MNAPDSMPEQGHKPKESGSKTTVPQVILASASPRRAQLLRQVGIEPACRPANIDESPLKQEDPVAYSLRLAKGKAAAIVDALKNTGNTDNLSLIPTLTDLPVLGSDTIVVLDGALLGQPRDTEEACAMLQALSGRTHQVTTAVAVWHQHRWQQAVSTSEVHFRPLSEAEIRAYVATGEPLDKAGAYAIQGYAAAFVPRIDGSFSGIMGLPLFETLALLKNVGVTPFN